MRAPLTNGRVSESVDEMDSKSIGGNTVRVRVPPRPLRNSTVHEQKALAYIVGVALGDGNLSKPNGRTVRLRISCDTHYPLIKEEIKKKLRLILPSSAIAEVQRPRHCIDISVYSNALATFIPWEVRRGSKQAQQARVPRWIWQEKGFIRECLRGLLQTDGSIYQDRKYIMVNFTNNVLPLCEDVFLMMQRLGYSPTLQQAKNRSGTKKYTVRLARKSEEFITAIEFIKA